MTSTDQENLLTWAERLRQAADTLRRRQTEDVVTDVALETIEAVANEMEIASGAAHTSTWPAPGGSGE